VLSRIAAFTLALALPSIAFAQRQVAPRFRAAAAMVVIDAVIRLIPGVLGDDESNQHDSFSSGNRLLEFAQYTRPREFRGHPVPEVLLSGNHEQIARWRREQSYLSTRQRRSDLLDPPNTEHTDGKD